MERVNTLTKEVRGATGLSMSCSSLTDVTLLCTFASACDLIRHLVSHVWAVA